ncbi:ComEA family DNA-binding protein [Patescibacteria group bacterium]|nr:ComEA family DNA-binding protein [Patescibacteria group bacterium]
MGEDNNSFEESSYYTEKILQIISVYKLPLILAGMGLVFLFASFMMLTRSQEGTGDIVFTQESTTSARSQIRVDVEGAVMSPGVYEMETENRIQDVLVAAGGLSAVADRSWVSKNLNKAAKLVDGGKIFIPSITDASEAKTQNSSTTIQNDTNSSGSQGSLLGVTTGIVNINNASQAQLEELPGVGPVTVSKIIAGRPYQAVEELLDRKIVGQALFSKIKDLITVF